MKKINILIAAIFMIVSYSLTAQVAVTNDGTSADASAMLEVKSTTKGFLPPRMTATQRDSICNPVDGLVVFNTTSKCLNFYADGCWIEMCGNLDSQTAYNSTTNETWMDRNLGASQVATSSTDTEAYGDLYQWGRAAEGHQLRTSVITSTTASTAVPGSGVNDWDGKFIKGSVDWLTSKNNYLWQGVNGDNNPCPAGYRLPTKTELNAERNSWNSNNSTGAFGSPIKFTLAGRREYCDGSLCNVGSFGYYWSSSVNGNSWHSSYLFFKCSSANVSSSGIRAKGYSVRCIKD